MTIWIPMRVWRKLEAVNGSYKKLIKKATNKKVKPDPTIALSVGEKDKPDTVVQPWKKVGEKITKVGYRYILRKEFILPDQRKSQFDIYYDNESVCIVAFTPHKSVILVRQYRPGPEKILLELPGGAVSPGEKPEEAIKRELLEEAGYSGEVQLVGSNYCSSLSNGIHYNFAGFNCVKTQEPTLDKEEFIEVVHLSLAEFIQLIKSGQMTNVDGAYMVLHSLNLLADIRTETSL